MAQLCKLCLGFLILAVTLQLAHSEDLPDENGSIFDLMSSKLTPSQQYQRNKNLQKQNFDPNVTPQLQAVKTSKEPPPEQHPDNGLPSELETLNRLNQELYSQKLDNLEKIADLERQLKNSVSKMETYRIQNLIDQQKLADKIQQRRVETLKKALDQMDEALANAPIEIEEEEEDDDNEDQLQISDTMLYVIGIGFLFLLLHAIRFIIGNRLDSFLQPALYNLFVDVTILALLCAFTLVLDYYNVFNETHIDFEMLTTGIATFILSWLLLGIVLIIAAQSFARTWMRQEDKCFDMRQLRMQYDSAFIEFDNNQRAERQFKQIRSDMQYAVMRHLFIRPVYLPIVTESNLRWDFDMSEYLKRGLADVISRGFQLSWLGYSIVIFGIVIWRLVLLTENETLEMALMWVIPFVIMILCIFYMKSLHTVYYKLVPYVHDSHEIRLPEDNSQRSPEMDVYATPEPPYLYGNIPGKNDEESFVNCFGNQVHPLKLSCAYLFAGRFPNRHELLFIFDFYGPRFMLGLLQAICVLLTLWSVVIVMFYADLIWDQIDWPSIFLIILAFVFWGFISFFLVPEAFRNLTLTTKIEQMKDREIIEQVILNTKRMQMLNTVKIYRQLKMIYREIQQFPQKDQLPEKMNDLLEESFYLIAEPEGNKYQLHISQLDDALLLCGIRLNEDELRLFAKECDPDTTQYINLDNFKRASSRLFESVALRPDLVAYVVLHHYFTVYKNKELDYELTTSDIEDFLNEFIWHLNEDDKAEFSLGTSFLLNDHGNLKVKDLAAMVRNDIESFPV